MANENIADLEARSRGRTIQISATVSDTRPYLTRHLPNSYRRRIQKLAQFYEVTQEEMTNCVLGHGLSALEKLVREQGVT